MLSAKIEPNRMVLLRVWFRMPAVSSRSLRPIAVGAAAAVLLLSSCSGGVSGDATGSVSTTTARSGPPASSPPVSPLSPTSPTSPTSAAQVGPVNVYAGAGAGKLSPVAKRAKNLVYVPNGAANTVQVIDPTTFRVIATYPTGGQPQHVVPSWDMKTLWVNDDIGNDLVPIDPITGKPGCARAASGHATAPPRSPKN